MKMLRGAVLSAFSLMAGLTFSGCRKDEASTKPPPAPIPVVQPAVKAQPTALKECAAPIEMAPPREFAIAGRTAVQAGYKLTFSGKDADGTLVFGVLGPVNEDSGSNMVALKRYIQFFTAEKVDAIFVTGDVSEEEAGLARILTTLAEPGWPVFVLSGNRDCLASFSNGVAAAQKTHPQVFNLNAVRAVEFAEATVVSLPGYHDPNYISCTQGAGCQYFQSTVDDVVRVAREARSPVVLVAHGPPHGSGAQALDYASVGGNVGDRAINSALAAGKISFGMFSNIKEAGGRATVDAEGTAQLKPDTLSKTLFLNPGPADTLGWEMNDGTKSVGLAAVMRLQDGQASWALFRNKPLSAAEKAEARRLEPAPRVEEATVAPAGGAVPRATDSDVQKRL